MSTIGAYGGSQPNQLLLSLLSRLTSTTATSATTASNDNSTSSTSTASASTSTDSSNALTGPSKAQLSDQVLQLLTMMQDTSAMTATTPTNMSSNTSSNTSSGTSQNGLSNLISAIDTDGDGSVSQSEMESYIEGKGGTQAQADSLFSALNQGNTGNLTQTQLASDLQNAQPLHRGHGHHHHHGGGDQQQASAGDVASKLMQAMDSNGDSSISQSEFENFVTSIGGTTSEADTDFSALNTQGSSGITSDQLTSAISAFQSSSATPTDAKNAILTMLDNLGNTSSTSAA